MNIINDKRLSNESIVNAKSDHVSSTLCNNVITH